MNNYSIKKILNRFPKEYNYNKECINGIRSHEYKNLSLRCFLWAEGFTTNGQVRIVVWFFNQSSVIV